MQQENLSIFPDLNEGKTKITTKVINPLRSDLYPFKTMSQLCYVSGKQAYNHTKDIGFPNFLLSGFIFCLQWAKIPHPVLNEMLYITLYIYFDCRSGQVRCFTISYNQSNKIDMYNFTNYIFENNIFSTPPGFNLPGVPKTKAIILVPPNHHRTCIRDHIYVTKKTKLITNPYFWDERTPPTLKVLHHLLIKKQKPELKYGLSETNKNLLEVIKRYNLWVHRKLDLLSKTPNFDSEEAKIFMDNLDWESFNCTIIK